ncbi:hypothetical protein [Ectothiorhodospira shaposhnikovii]|uniref:hypothetical protein n=1 Tax=Ectothiorhodospira shaposhnikovii TaxID=1054 RepID=UPI001EE8B878|nr:hypothetical protein [Ectothiorhodospira shaposhnikovii]MCG5514384.1 hypothetical protein [Ectothiorhodospira shaposhnikovii]
MIDIDGRPGNNPGNQGCGLQMLEMIGFNALVCSPMAITFDKPQYGLRVCPAGGTEGAFPIPSRMDLKSLLMTLFQASDRYPVLYHN